MRKFNRMLLNAVKPYGYHLEKGQRGHMSIINPTTGHRLSVSSSPKSEVYAVRNVLKDIQRYGGTR